LTWSFGWTAVFRSDRDPEALVRPRSEDLVDVHVRLRAAAGLPDDEGKVFVERAVDELVRRCEDRRDEARRQLVALDASTSITARFTRP
jgi:hypothetical protein